MSSSFDSTVALVERWHDADFELLAQGLTAGEQMHALSIAMKRGAIRA